MHTVDVFIGAEWEAVKNVDIGSFSISVHLLSDFILGLFGVFLILMDNCHNIFFFCFVFLNVVSHGSLEKMLLSSMQILKYDLTVWQCCSSLVFLFCFFFF